MEEQLIVVGLIPLIPPEKYEQPKKISFFTTRHQEVGELFLPPSIVEKYLKITTDFILLTEANVDFRKGIRPLGEYLNPFYLSGKAKIGESRMEYTIELCTFLPLYHLTKQCDLPNLQLLLLSSVYSMTGRQLHRLYESEMNTYPQYQELHQALLFVLSKKMVLGEMLGKIEYLPILEISSRTDVKIHYLIDWLKSIFNHKELWEKDTPRIANLLNLVPNDSEEGSFVLWIYSGHIPEIEGEKYFLPYSHSYVINENWNLTAEQIKWFCDQKNSEEIDHIMPIIIEYLRLTHSGEIFNSVVRLTNLPGSNANGGEDLGVLLTMAANPPIIDDFCDYNSMKNKIIVELSSTDKWKSAYNDQTPSLTWEDFIRAFKHDDGAFIKLAFKWCKTNNDFTNFFEVIKEFTFEDYEIWYYLVKVYDCTKGKVHHNLLGEIDYKKLLLYIMKRNKVINFNENTFEYIHNHCKEYTEQQISFVSFLHHFDVKLDNDQLLLPIYPESLMDCVSLLIQIEKRTIFDSLVEVAKNSVDKLTFKDVDLISQMIPFNILFDFDTVIENEDIVVYYASMSTEFNSDLINWGQISFRLFSQMLIGNKIKFQFPSNIPKINLMKFPIYNTEFCLLSDSRVVHHKIIHVIVLEDYNEKHKVEVKIFFRIMGYFDTEVFFNDDMSVDLDGVDAVVVLLPHFAQISSTQISLFLQKYDDIKIPFFVSANVIHLVNLITCYFDDDDMKQIKWKFINFDMPKDDFQIIDIESGNDLVFHSIPIQIPIKYEGISFDNGRPFCSHIVNSNWNIFNFDFLGLTQDLIPEKIYIYKFEAKCFSAFLRKIL